jgi:DNA-binding transcriptional LysR family regulator
MVTDTNSSKYSAIRRGCGIGLVFDNAFSLAPLLKDCKLVPMAEPLTVDWLCLTWREDKLAEAGRQFLEFVLARR